MAAAPSSMTADIQRHLLCSICHEQYKSPRFLPCHHSFCLGCLENLVQVTQPQGRQRFHCPTCRAVAEVPLDGVGKFPVNFYVEGALENLHIGQVSSTSESGTALTRNTPSKGSLRAVNERYCSTHTDKRIRFFCTKCNIVLCRDCKMTDHEGHPTTTLAQKSEETKKMIINVTQKSRTSLMPKLKQALQDAEQHKQKLEEDKTSILSELKKQAKQIKQLVDGCLQQAEQNLTSTSASLEQETSKSISQMQEQLASLESLCSHAEHAAQSGCDVDILALPAQMAALFGVDLSVVDTYRLSNGLFQSPVHQFRVQGYGLEQDFFQSGESTPNRCKLNVFTTNKWRKNMTLTKMSRDFDYGYQNQSTETGTLQNLISNTIGRVSVCPVPGHFAVTGSFADFDDDFDDDDDDPYSGSHSQFHRFGSGQAIPRQIYPIPAQPSCPVSTDIAHIQTVIRGWADPHAYQTSQSFMRGRNTYFM